MRPEIRTPAHRGISLVLMVALVAVEVEVLSSGGDCSRVLDGEEVSSTS